MASTEQLRKLYPDLNDQDLGEIKKRFAEYLQLAALVFQERNTGNVHHEYSITRWKVIPSPPPNTNQRLTRF